MEVIKAQEVIVMEKEPFNQYKYIADFKKENYDRVEILVAKGAKKKLKDISNTTGLTVSQILVDATEEKYKIDLTTKEQ